MTTNRFEKANTNVVVDHQTSLEWQAEAARPMTWEDAKKYAKNLDLSGYMDWRLPTIKEMESLVNQKLIDPASAFPGMPSSPFWSSSVSVYSTSHAWLIDFHYGYVNNYGKDDIALVRCVRQNLANTTQKKLVHEKEQCCRNCRFGRKINIGDRRGNISCHKHAPAVQAIRIPQGDYSSQWSSKTMWPTLRPTSWCGEWEPEYEKASYRED